MEEPTTKPSGSKPASPSSTYSDTDRSEVNTPAGLAPAVREPTVGRLRLPHRRTLVLLLIAEQRHGPPPISLVTVRRGNYRPRRLASTVRGPSA